MIHLVILTAAWLPAFVMWVVDYARGRTSQVEAVFGSVVAGLTAGMLAAAWAGEFA